MKAPQASAPRTGVHISLDPTMLAEVDRLALDEGLSRSGLIRRALQEWMDNAAEDAALAREARRRLEDPNEPRIAWAQAKRELRS